jgi:hypothetical protein
MFYECQNFFFVVNGRHHALFTLHNTTMHRNKNSIVSPRFENLSSRFVLFTCLIQIYEWKKINNRLNTITQRYKEQKQISSEQ